MVFSLLTCHLSLPATRPEESQRMGGMGLQGTETRTILNECNKQTDREPKAKGGGRGGKRGRWYLGPSPPFLHHHTRAEKRTSNIRKCRSRRRRKVAEVGPGGGGSRGKGPPLRNGPPPPHLRGSSFTDRRHSHRCKQCTERSLLRGVPGRAGPSWRWWAE